MLECRIHSVGIFIVVCLATAYATGDDKTPAASKRKIDFKSDVAPILIRSCIDCHGPVLQLADLRLDQRQHVIVEGEDRGLIKAGHSAESLLVQRLVDKKLGLIMPPTFPFFPEDTVGLPESQIKILKQWIDEGAQWPDGVSLSAEQGAESPQAKMLFTSIRNNDRRAMETLLANGALVNSADRHGCTPLMKAALYGDAMLMETLIQQGADIHATDSSGATALMFAAGDLSKVRLLVKNGANVDVHSDLGRSPLLIACTYPGNIEVVRFLIQSGAKITDRDKFGETVLTSASKRGDVQLVTALIDAGADVNSGGGFVGRSPLAWAAEEGNMETVALLLKHGAAKDLKSINSALFNAAVRGSTATVRLLLENGANANVPAGFAAYTPLLGAAYSDDSSEELVQLLLDHGADRQAKAATGDTALVLARKHGKTKIVELLAKNAAPLEATGESQKKLARPTQIKDAVEKSIALLQRCGPEFFRKSGCIACHQQSMTSLTLAAARTRGLRVDEETAREQVQVAAQTVRSYRDRFLQRVDHPVNSGISTGYILLGLAAENYPPDDYTDANIIEMASRQSLDGSWTAFAHRPPMEYSRVAATALAIRAMQLYCPPALKKSFDNRIERGRDWLTKAVPVSNTEHAFRLLGLAWTGAKDSIRESQKGKLLAQQREDGGWSQLESLESDTYATGLTLYALHHAGGVATSEPAYQRGINYLLETQLEDGSWHVRSRSFPFQSYFESGFPHGPDQWISASATGFAAIALIDSMPAASSTK